MRAMVYQKLLLLLEACLKLLVPHQAYPLSLQPHQEEASPAPRLCLLFWKTLAVRQLLFWSQALMVAKQGLLVPQRPLLSLLQYPLPLEISPLLLLPLQQQLPLAQRHLKRQPLQPLRHRPPPPQPLLPLLLLLQQLPLLLLQQLPLLLLQPLPLLHLPPH